MAGLDNTGFTPLSYEEIKTRIGSRLEAYNPGFDLTPESPDGQLVDIISFELGQAWNELNLVFNSYNPEEATGAGLRNIGLITGIPYGVATRSVCTIDLTGTAGTVVPRGSLVTDAAGNEFQTQLKATIPASVEVIAMVSGYIAMPIGTVTTIQTPVTGWTAIDQPAIGRAGATAQSETAYRNIRNRTVLRNFSGVEAVMQARLLELGIAQATIVNNDSKTVTLADGTPPQTIHVTIGEISGISDMDIARTILATKGLGCPTYGSTAVASVLDAQGLAHTINFSKASAVSIFADIDVTFLDPDFAGATDAMKAALLAEINSLLTGEDVVWSRLFGLLTPYGKAQINTLEIGFSAITTAAANLVIGEDEYANMVIGDINLTVT